MAGRRLRVPWLDRLVLLPIATTLVVVPLIVYLKVIPLDNELYGFWNGQPANFDFFSFYKSRIVAAMAAIILVGLVLGIVQRSPWLSKLPPVARFCLGSYPVLAVASTWSSPFRSVALNGFPDRYEGLLVLLAYIVMALASFAVVSSPARVAFIVRCFALSGIGVSAIALLQYAGFDPLRTSWGQWLILPGAYEGSALQLHYPAEARTVYATLFHYDYVGSYTALAFPFFLALALSGIASRATTRLLQIAASVTGLVWLACGSRAGLVGGVLALTVLAIGLRSQVRWSIVVISSAVVVSLVTLDLAAGGRVRARADSIANDFRVLFSGETNNRPPLPIEIVRIDLADIHLKTPAGPLLVHYDAGNLTIFDEERRQPLRVAVEQQTGRLRIDDDRYSMLVCRLGRIDRQPALVMGQGDYVLNFLLLNSGIRLALKTGRPVWYQPVDSFGFEGREALGSARGYIWSRSLPLLRQTVFLGFGPDTFAMIFPQQDLAGKFRAYGTTDILVDKPHNFFLQIALATGVLSALLLMTLFVWYCAASAAAYFRSAAANDSGRAVGLACFAAVVGYLGAALFNDSIVGVAPVFWVVLGLGIRMNSEGTR